MAETAVILAAGTPRASVMGSIDVCSGDVAMPESKKKNTSITSTKGKAKTIKEAPAAQPPLDLSAAIISTLEQRASFKQPC